MPTKAAEEIYSVLEKYADASPRYYDKEGFIYSYGVVPNPPNKFRLRCFDNKRRTFIKNGDNYRLDGPNSAKINSLITQILADNVIPKKIEDFDVITTRV